MPLKVYNTLKRKKEEFVPLMEGKIGMYTCGITVYDVCHIGHARSAIVFDVIRRYLEKLGYQVTYARNLTDIDDKIINKANKENKSIVEITQKYIREYYDDMEKLGVRKANIEPRATDHIEEMKKMIAGLIDKGYAYEKDGDVYFEVRKFKGYGKLSGRNLDELKAGARVEINEKKKDPLDFVLWKRSKPGEPQWKSSWGEGRPGWHMECSVMSQKYLGDTLDIHAGGQDLIFPHHENEIAQSEGLTGKPFVRFWLHNGFVNINKEKMSKSLGNFFTIKEVLGKYDAEVVRFFLLSTHYRSPIDFSDKGLDEAGNALRRVYDTLYNISDILDKEKDSQGKIDEAFQEKVKKCENNFTEGMNDDFNTAKAIASVFELVRETNIFLTGAHSTGNLRNVRNKIKDLGKVLGLFQAEDVKKDLEEVVGLKIKERNEARKNKDFATSDRIRDELKEMGIILEDKKDGTRWKKI